MRLIPSDPDVATIYGRITNGELDLRPNFQRGEVWSSVKKQKLIDSVLREWHVPPIHVIQRPDGGEDEVLDGQQRLVAVRDFLNNRLRINGRIEPFDETIFALDGLTFAELPPEWKRKVLRFPIRLFSIVDFSPSEPSELFYRLNQPASLTAAEQRNSFFGEPREQIKELVVRMEKLGLDKEFLGFSNSRMAYDDVLARVCVALENGLNAKVSANLLADRYRSGIPFHFDSYRRVENSITILAQVKHQIQNPFKLNKASLFSWLVFVCRLLQELPEFPIERYALFFANFERERFFYSLGAKSNHFIDRIKSNLFEIYTDRVTSRVADVSSVLLRDAALWGVFLAFKGLESGNGSSKLDALLDFLRRQEKLNNHLPERDLLEFVLESGSEWGSI